MVHGWGLLTGSRLDLPRGRKAALADAGEPPTLPELGILFTWNPVFNGWMFHIGLWSHNPDGMFDDFNPSVALCD